MPKKEEPACEPLWTRQPDVLLNTNLLTTDICESNNINAFTRALLLGLVTSSLLFPLLDWGGLVLILLSLLFLYGQWIFAKVFPEERTVVRMRKENFTGAPVRRKQKEENAFPVIASSPGATVTKPSLRNPFMNVLLDEIKYNPTRPPADSVTDYKNSVALDDFFRVQWNSDPTDVFGRSQGQRQFYTTPSTSIPNDQGSYQNWLYLIPGKTCKEGGRDACVPGTNGGPVTWLNKPN